MMNEELKASKIKCIINNSKEPILIRNTLKWELLDWSLEDWKNNIGDEKMVFRLGRNQKTVQPQWERKTRLFEETFEYFLKHTQGDSLEWLYFDYKYLNNCFNNVHKLRSEIRWDPLGFPEIKPEDCTIWIGSKGAHTPCHIDTYGYNLVYQVYGKKLWMLFPPEESLKPSRVPYEESSIYSELNFFSPNLDDFKSFTNKCKKVVLQPGDVLLVPHKWWHYVENLEMSISINVWLPLPQDDEERLREAIVQLFVKQMSDSNNVAMTTHILNPNMEEVILQNDRSSICSNLIETCRIAQRENVKHKKSKLESESIDNVDESIISNLMHECECVNILPTLTREEFISQMQGQSKRFEQKICDQEPIIVNSGDEDIIKIFKVLTDPEVVELIKNKLHKGFT
ncbi:hypothetical protein JTB14_005841 [Gonioctena quinquepunctata]|nr:hypothetical protein JTB14_005841 [Gonioctena quinquepunctata]